MNKLLRENWWQVLVVLTSIVLLIGLVSTKVGSERNEVNQHVECVNESLY